MGPSRSSDRGPDDPFRFETAEPVLETEIWVLIEIWSDAGVRDYAAFLTLQHVLEGGKARDKFKSLDQPPHL